MSTIKISKKNQAFFFERLELYISSGLSLSKSVELCLHDFPKKYDKISDKILKSIIDGSSLSNTLMSINISPTIKSIIQNGEKSGNLGASLLDAKFLLEREDELRKKCVNALIYPGVIGAFSLLLTLGLIKGVMPQIIPLIKSLHIKLPLLTVFVISISEYILKNGLYILLVSGLIITGLVTVYKKILPVRATFQRSVINIPLIGKVIRYYVVCTLLKSLGLLLNSGLSLERSYLSICHSINFLPLKSLLQKNIDKIKNGIQISQIFLQTKLFPDFVISLIKAGEQGGSLGRSMIRASSILDGEIENLLKRLTSLIEPLMMALMGIVVGGIALSIMMPIYDISKTLQH